MRSREPHSAGRSSGSICACRRVAVWNTHRRPGGRWADAAESYAGGVAGAIFLLAVYVLVFYVARTPLRSPAWFGAGFGPVLWIGTQLMVGMAEGSIRDRNYGQVLDANPALTLSFVVGTMLAGAAVHIWLWRAVWRRQPPQP